jgi:RNA polymerase sigma-70 factor (sigma-E family)
VRRRERHDTEFTEFVASRSTQLYRSAYLLTTSAAAAEDLLQTTLAKAYVAWGRVRDADDPNAYVHGVLTKSFLSEKRRRSSSELPVADPADGAQAAGPITGADPTDRIALMAALRQLAPLDRAVVVLRYWDDHSVADTARRLDLSEAAVKNRSLRSLRTLRELLSEHPDPLLTRGTTPVQQADPTTRRTR